MIGYFLDDERNPEDVTWVQYPTNVEWYVFRRLNDLLFACYMTEDWSEVIISLDHDIADHNTFGQEVTGYDAIKAICNVLTNALPTVVVHSQNPVGKKNIEMYWANFKKHFQN